MDCQTALRRMGEGEAGPALASHLARCPACRAEAEFQRRIAAATAAMPRVQAPESLVGRVTAGLRPLAPLVPSRPRPPLLRLRTVEAGWLAALFLVLMVGAWLLGRSTALQGWRSVAAAVVQAAQSPREALGAWTPISLDAGLRGSTVAGLLQAGAAALTQVPSSWTLALVGFGISLLWLLARHGDFRARPEWEDARA
jgi:hypothetical protein